MEWKKLGLVWAPDGTTPWARTHAMVPTPVLWSAGTIRVFVNCLDEKGRSRPIHVDVDADDPTRVKGAPSRPLMDLGERGTFDENGVLFTSVVQRSPSELYAYYAGFELSPTVRYRIFSGLAVSRDGGGSFSRMGQVPILDRCEGELYFRGGPFVLKEGDRYKIWYVGGDRWTMVEGKESPVYDLRYLESADGVHWPSPGKVCLTLREPEEHGFGRPWVVRKEGAGYRLFYSIRKRALGAYRLGYAESPDGIHWERRDGEMGLDVSPGGFESEAIMYAAVIRAGERTYCFYNGNRFGVDGFAVAELAE